MEAPSRIEVTPTISTVLPSDIAFKDPASLSAEEVKSYAQGLVQLASLLAVYLGAQAPNEDEEAPPTTPRPPPICNPIELGHLAIRDDGAILLSTEDCEDRDLSDRRLHTFIILTDEDAAFAHEKALDGIAFAAARVANKLPRKLP